MPEVLHQGARGTEWADTRKARGAGLECTCCTLVRRTSTFCLASGTDAGQGWREMPVRHASILLAGSHPGGGSGPVCHPHMG